jgi:hypothetical protein
MTSSRCPIFPSDATCKTKTNTDYYVSLLQLLQIRNIPV